MLRKHRMDMDTDTIHRQAPKT
ncbi:unnamed protein product, partial [Allacma fusca]